MTLPVSNIYFSKNIKSNIKDRLNTFMNDILDDSL